MRCQRMMGGVLDNETHDFIGEYPCSGKMIKEDHGDWIYMECKKCGSRHVRDKRT